MLAARYSEKMLKARLLKSGVDLEWGHNLTKLVQLLPLFDGRDEALEIASELEPYSTQAAYPSIVRDSLPSEDAREAYDLAMRLVEITAMFDSPAQPESDETRV